MTAWSGTVALAAELARERERSRRLAAALRGLVEAVDAEHRIGNMADYTEGFVAAYRAAARAAAEAAD